VTRLGTILARRLSPQRAGKMLHQVFGHIVTGFEFRLWDGTRVTLGHGAPVCTAMVHRAETFVRLLRDPSPLNFAEAYVEGAIDVEGDLFAAMKVADAMEEIRLSFRDRLRLLIDLWRG
jgi:cyclopropane-fatty-acyl-phospholipid synthase